MGAEDLKETRRLPRPLPVPNPSRNTTPEPKTAALSTVTPTNFYGSNIWKDVAQSAKAGSSHTKYHSSDRLSPPPYANKENSPFREPELVMDEPIPELISRQDQNTWSHNGAWGSTNDWSMSTDNNNNWGASTSGWDDSAWAGGLGPADFSSSMTIDKKIDIDGRNDDEEKNWWNPTAREHYPPRPGLGVLPPLLEDSLHNRDHSLFSVSAAPPELKPARVSSGGRSSTSSESGSSSGSAPSFVPPSVDEVHTAVPHPHAYYCRKHNGWVLLLWKSSSVFPPLAKSFQASMRENGIVLPDQSRRKLTNSCIGDGEQPVGPANKTHHFHVYQRAVDASHLNPPFNRCDWEKVEKVKLQRRRMTIQGDVDEEMVSVDKVSDGSMMDDDPPEEETEGDLLDLYVCCQCSFYCVASPDIIPGVLPVKYLEDFTREKRENPPPDKTGEESVLSGYETMITVIENKLWKGESRSLPVLRPGFQRKMGWNDTVRNIFKILGFELKPTRPSSDTEQALAPPSVDLNTPEGRSNRAKLLRAWVELSAWVVDYQRRFANALKNYDATPRSVKIESAREMYQTAIGAHPQQIPRGLLPDSLLQYTALSEDWEGLGMTPTSYSWELLVFAYLAQCRCAPDKTIDNFTHLHNIVYAFQTLGEQAPQELQSFVIEERGRWRFTRDDIQRAITTLGFGQGNRLNLDFDDDTDDDFIRMAWRNALKEAWAHPTESEAVRKEVNEAFMILAQARGSTKLMALWEEEQITGMTPDRAYSTLEVGANVEEELLLTVFSFRVEEQPSQIEKMRHAMSVIAEVRDSRRLKEFLETGKDPGVITAAISPEMPRGLDQLGNTCYLNSLLQYFYTIKDLREAVKSAADGDVKFLDDEKFTEDDLKRHRVGGRLVTKREILRSKKFVKQLADLFCQLEFCEMASVTPKIELAKLALVTSKDEEEEIGDAARTDSSNDTDATLVEDVSTRYAEPEQGSPSPTRNSPSSSVLGKRPRTRERKLSDMDIDTPLESEKDRDDVARVSKSPRSPGQMTPPYEGGSSSSKGDKDGDVEMLDGQHSQEKSYRQPPPLPPRKATKVADSSMMFGRQHDVAECMDNCMFQIETALLKFDELDDSEDDKTSIVKRLFYGKIRQRLTAPQDERTSRFSVHEKEDLFSHLPVNVSEEGYDIYDGLSGYFDDVVEFEGKKARMEVTLVDLPPLLQIQLQRVQFNRETLQPYKSQAYLKFGETIYMDRFLDSTNPQKKAKSEAIQADLNACRERIQRLTQGKYAPFDPALEDTHEFLLKQEAITLPECGEDFLAELSMERERVKVQIEELRSRAADLKKELEAVWQDDTQAAYELTSVFIHRGASASWGHYFFYSRHLPDNPDSWFKYNDSTVSVVPKDEVLGDSTGSNANPYLLVFMRKDAEVVHTVNRFDPASLLEDDAT